MLSENQVLEQIVEKSGITVRPRTLERFAAAGLIGKPVLISNEKNFWPDNTVSRFIKAARKMAQSSMFKSHLIHRRFEREGDNITMYSTYDFSDIYRANYLDRMNGERYTDKEKDFAKIWRCPIPMWVNWTPEQRYEYDTNTKALRKLLQERPELRTSTASI